MPQQPVNSRWFIAARAGFNRDRLDLNVAESNPAWPPFNCFRFNLPPVVSTVRLIEQQVPKNTYNNHVELLVDGKEAFDKMKEYIRSAKQAVYVEMFLFHSDKTGWEFANELVAKKKQGVDVKLLLDAMGQVNESGEVVKFLQQNGVDVKLYNKKLFDWENVNITHRKLVLVDGHKGVTGGMNIGDEYQYEWHDLMAAVQGESVQEMQTEFFQNWKHAGGQVPAVLPRLPVGMKFGTSRRPG